MEKEISIAEDIVGDTGSDITGVDYDAYTEGVNFAFEATRDKLVAMRDAVTEAHRTNPDNVVGLFAAFVKFVEMDEDEAADMDWVDWADWFYSQPTICGVLLDMLQRGESHTWFTRRVRAALEAEHKASVDTANEAIEAMNQDLPPYRHIRSLPYETIRWNEDDMAKSKHFTPKDAAEASKKPKPRPVADSDEAVEAAVLSMIATNPGWTAKTYADACEGADAKRCMRVIGKLERTVLKAVATEKTKGEGTYNRLFINGVVYKGKSYTFRELAAHPDNVHGHTFQTLANRLNPKNKKVWSVAESLSVPSTANNSKGKNGK